MNKAKPKPSPNALRSYEEFADWLPHRISKRQLLNMAGERFPPCVRVHPRATPLWNERDVVEWVAATFGQVLPEFVARLRLEGFSGKPFSHGERL